MNSGTNLQALRIIKANFRSFTKSWANWNSSTQLAVAEISLWLHTGSCGFWNLKYCVHFIRPDRASLIFAILSGLMWICSTELNTKSSPHALQKWLCGLLTTKWICLSALSSGSIFHASHWKNLQTSQTEMLCKSTGERLFQKTNFLLFWVIRPLWENKYEPSFKKMTLTKFS